MNKISNTLCLSVLVSLFLFACGGSSQYGETAAEGTSDETATETKEAEAPKTAVGATGKIDNWDTWLAAYNADVPKEVQMGILRSADDPSTIFVFQSTESHMAAREMFASEETQTKIAESGASGLEFTYYDLVRLGDDPESKQRLLVGHEVQDFDTWLTAFDNDAENRAEAGLAFVGLARDADNANMVYIMFAADDRDAVDAMIESDEMKQVMRDAGVIGEPNIGWWMVAGEEEAM